MIEERVKLEQADKMLGVSAREINRRVPLWNNGRKDAMSIKKSQGRCRKLEECHSVR